MALDVYFSFVIRP